MPPSRRWRLYHRADGNRSASVYTSDSVAGDMPIVRLDDWDDTKENLDKVLDDLGPDDVNKRFIELRREYGADGKDEELREEVATKEMDERRDVLIPFWRTNGTSAVFYSAATHHHQGGMSDISKVLVARMAVNYDLRRQVLSDSIIVTHRPRTDTHGGVDPAGGTREQQRKKHRGWNIGDELHTTGPVWVNVETAGEGYGSQLGKVTRHGDIYDNSTRTIVYRIRLPSALAMLQYHPIPDDASDASDIHGVIPPGTFHVKGKDGDTVDMTMELPGAGTLDTLKLHGCTISLWGGLEFKY